MVKGGSYTFLSASTHFQDIEISFEGNSYKAHKAVLYEHSVFFREILKKDPAIQRIEVDEDTMCTKFWGCWNYLEETITAIYHGSLGGSYASIALDVLYAVENYDTGLATGTLCMMDAATSLFQRQLAAFLAPGDKEWDEEEAKLLLDHTIPVIYSPDRAEKFPMNDSARRKEFVDVVFPFLLKHGDAGELEEALKETPSFAVDFAVFLAKKHFEQTK
ncbi:hypothetical protein HDK64DRAFT_310971 [Phyllosticta capitalensis]